MGSSVTSSAKEEVPTTAIAATMESVKYLDVIVCP